MIVADQGHLNIIEYMITEYENGIDINAKNIVSIVIYYIWYSIYGMCVDGYL